MSHPNTTVKPAGDEIPVARVSDYMTKRVIHAVDPNSTIAKAAKRMKEFGVGCLIAVDGARPVGIITERDLVQRVLAEGHSAEALKVSEVMSKELITIRPEALVIDAAKIMVENKVRRLVVTKGVHVVGIFTATDLARALLRKSRFNPVLTAITRAAPPLTGPSSDEG
jgi:CBS domain-containing protein